jgi:hypothetical protein
MSKTSAVKALLIAMSMLPSQAPSMRAKAFRLVPASTTAIFTADQFPSLASPGAIPRWVFSLVIKKFSDHRKKSTTFARQTFRRDKRNCRPTNVNTVLSLGSSIGVREITNKRQFHGPLQIGVGRCGGAG